MTREQVREHLFMLLDLQKRKIYAKSETEYALLENQIGDLVEVIADVAAGAEQDFSKTQARIIEITGQDSFIK